MRHLRKAAAILALSMIAWAISAPAAAAQKYSIEYLQMETMAPGIDTTPANINPGGPVPAYFSDQTWNGGTTVTIAGAAYAAGLSKRAVALPANVSQCTLSYQIRVSQTAAANSQANETDLMIVDPNGTLYNGSMRKNNQEGGRWQITNSAGGWVDAGFNPGPFPPDVWTPVAVVYQANWSAQSLTILSIFDGTQSLLTPFSVPATFKPEVMANSGWQKSILDVQIQDTLMVAGAYTRDMRDITIECQ